MMARMELGQRLFTSQQMQQKMKITPQQIMSANLLQLQQMDLEVRILQELEENPVLELVPKQEEPELPDEESADDLTDEPEVDYYETYTERTFSRKSDDDTLDKHHLLEMTEDREQTLYDYLTEQLEELHLPREMNEIAEMILINLSDEGFLEVDENGQPLIYMDDRFNREQIDEILEIIRSFDPAGIAVLNHQESLLLQLRRLDGEYPVVQRILRDHYEDLLSNRIPKIARALGIAVDDVTQAVEIIRNNLRPNPAGDFAPDEPMYIAPDVIVRKVEGEYEISLNNDFSEGIRVGSDFAKKLNDSVGDAKGFLKDKIVSANMLIRAIEQRRETLIRITESLVRHQIDWFDGNRSEPIGITRFDIAQEINVHHSTVSRGVMNKYMQTPRGIYPFSYFFGGSLDVTNSAPAYADDDSDDEKSVREIKRILRQIVDNEDKHKPLSDTKIQKEIEKRTGVEIARRTVAKYRTALGILSSSKRKEY